MKKVKTGTKLSERKAKSTPARFNKETGPKKKPGVVNESEQNTVTNEIDEDKDLYPLSETSKDSERYQDEQQAELQDIKDEIDGKKEEDVRDYEIANRKKEIENKRN